MGIKFAKPTYMYNADSVWLTYFLEEDYLGSEVHLSGIRYGRISVTVLFANAFVHLRFTNGPTKIFYSWIFDGVEAVYYFPKNDLSFLVFFFFC